MMLNNCHSGHYYYYSRNYFNAMCSCVLFCEGPFKCYVTQWGGGGWVSAVPEKSIRKVYNSTLLALRGGGWGSNFKEKNDLNGS